MNAGESSFDLVIRNGRVIDPANGVNGSFDLAIRGGRIAGMGVGIPAPDAQVLDARGGLVCPGFIDLHVHVYEWVTNFGLPPDAAGLHSGSTTIVDQGSAGAWTFGGFKAYVADPARTDVRSFVSINVAGALKGGMEGTTLHNPGMVDVGELVAVARANPRLVRGIKCHCESGALSHWGTEVLKLAAEAGREADIPLYVHTGHLFPINAANRPEPAGVASQVLPLLRAGDVMAHVYSCMPDGIMGKGSAVPEWIAEAQARGVLFDLGHGMNFSYRIARAMMAKGIYPDTLGSDVHADFNAYHDFSILDYSLVGGLNKLLALGMPLDRAIAGLTSTPARVLRDASIGHLGVGARANVTVLSTLEGPWTYVDAEGACLDVEERLVPEWVVIDGQPLRPDCGLLSDVLPPEARPRGVTRPHGLSAPRRTPTRIANTR